MHKVQLQTCQLYHKLRADIWLQLLYHSYPTQGIPRENTTKHKNDDQSQVYKMHITILVFSVTKTLHFAAFHTVITRNYCARN